MDSESVESLQLLTLQQAADRLSVSRRTLEREIQRGAFPAPLKIGRAARVALSDLLLYVESLRTPKGLAS